MSEALYLTDCYLKSWEAVVKKVSQSRYIVLDRTAFYPNSGGQPYDTGIIKRLADEKEFRVVYAGKFSGEISHEVDKEGLKPGDRVHCEIDWNRRYMHMRYHTASHILFAVINKKTGALITGNQIDKEKTRIDFSLELMDRGLIPTFEAETNEIIKNGYPVVFEFISREEALKRPHLASLAKGLPEAEKIRIVKIGDFNEQACGGTHVKNTKEIGHLKIIDFVNKGKNNRRIYFIVE